MSAEVLQKLNLTAEQKQKIADLQKEYQSKVLDLLTAEQKKQFEELNKGGAQEPAKPDATPTKPGRSRPRNP